MDTIKSSAIDIRPPESKKPYSLEEYLQDTVLIPLSKFDDSYDIALPMALEYMRDNPTAVIVIPPQTDEDENLSYLVNKVGTSGTLQINYVGYGNPSDLRDCPVIRDDKHWKVNDVLINPEFSKLYRNRQWVCMAPSTDDSEAQWLVQEHDKRHYSEVEIVGELPEAKSSQEGRLVILKTAFTEQLFCCLNTSGNTTTEDFTWIEVGVSGGTDAIQKELDDLKKTVEALSEKVNGSA